MNQEEFKRRLTAILSADVEGYSLLMREDEEATIRTLKTYRTAMRNLIQRYRGRVVDSPGDNILSEFSSVVDAVNCAVEIQRELAERNSELPHERRMRFRIGVNLGDVVEDGERIYGDGVNIAARMEGLAEGGGICISGTVYDQVKHKLGLEYEYLGEQEVKNMPEPIRAYRILSYPGAAAHRVVKAKRAVGKTWRNVVVAIVAVLVVGAAVAIWHFYFRPPSQEVASVEKMAFPLPDKPSIAVLPFVNMSGDPKQEYFSDGLTDQIINGLSKVPDLFVIARNSTFTYKGKPVKVQKIAEDLGVKYILEGSVQKTTDRIRITTQLIDATTGRHLWSERYDRDLKDIFAIQDDITMETMKAMRVELRGDQARMWVKHETTNLQAYEKFLEAGSYWRRFTKGDNAQARQLFEEAVAIDPQFAAAYALVGWTHFIDARFGWTESRVKSIKMAFIYAQKTLEMDDTIDYAHTLLSAVYLLKRQYEKAVAAAEHAITLNPNGAILYDTLAGVVGCSGRWEDSIIYAKKSIRLAPFPQITVFHWLGRAYFMTGQYDEAILTFKKALGISPNYLPAHAFLAASYSSLGRETEAVAAAEEVLRINPKFCLESYAKTLPYKNKSDIERYMAALRKAGLPKTPPLPLPDKPSIAVLPFANMSGDPEQEYFSDGVTESIITALSKAPRLFVISRSSTFTYKGKPVNVKEVSRELGARYVLEGSVQRSEDRVRITAQLIDATTGSHIWAERYDRDLRDVFALQDEITMKIVAAMQLKLTEGETARLHLKGTNNLEAYTKWLQAHFYFNQITPDDNERARKLAEQVISLEPDYAAAYSLLALIYVQEVSYNPRKATKERIQQSIKLAQKALSMDDSDPLSHVALGRVYYMIRQYEKAIVELNQALALDPNLVEANRWLGFALIGVEKPEEALPFIKKALRLNPVEKGRTFALGFAYLRMGQYEEAIEAHKEVIRFRPNHFFAHFCLALSYVALDREQEAHAEATEAFRINPNYSLEEFKKERATSGPSSDPVLRARFYDLLRKVGFK